MKLRKMEPTDLPAFFAVLASERIDYYPIDPQSSSAEELQNEFRLLFPHGVFLVFEQEPRGGCVGYCYAEAVNVKNQNLEFHFGLAPELCHGGDHFVACLALCTRYFFRYMNMHMIWSGAFDFESAKREALVAGGARSVGILPHALFRDGAYHDKFMFALVAEDFQPQGA